MYLLWTIVAIVMQSILCSTYLFSNLKEKRSGQSYNVNGQRISTQGKKKNIIEPNYFDIIR